jgi:hypothetical protein
MTVPRANQAPFQRGGKDTRAGTEPAEQPWSSKLKAWVLSLAIASAASICTSVPMPRSLSQSCTSCWRPRTYTTRSACQPGVVAADRSPSEPTGRPAAQKAGRDVHQFPLAGRGLEETPARGGQGRVVSGRTLSPRRLHRDEPDSAQQAGGQVLQRRVTAEQHIREGKNALRWTRLSCHASQQNAVRLQLHALAYNLANFHAHRGATLRRLSIGR